MRVCRFLEVSPLVGETRRSWLLRREGAAPYVSEGIQTMIWTDSEVAAPHWSVAVAVMTGWEASLPPVERNATIDSPVPRKPWVLEDQVTMITSPFGSLAIAESATFAPQSLRSAS